MIVIKSPFHFPPNNIASEEYLIKNFKEDIFLLYINDPTIIVGQHQNTLSEINLEYIKENNIHVVRRLSGGGAVFHDRGNLNFSFITNTEGKNIIDFKRYTLPIINALQSIGVNAKFEGRNDLCVDGNKFSGNASHIYKNRICHHGTILFNTDMTRLSKSLRPSEDKFKDKAVKSVRSRVVNISEYINDDYTIEDLQDLIINQVVKDVQNAKEYNYSIEDTESIKKLSKEKYETWEWTYGNSPKYNVANKVKTSSGKIESFLLVENGIIKEFSIYGDYFSEKPTDDFIKMFINISHNFEDISQQLNTIDIHSYFHGFDKKDIMSLFF